MKQNLAVLILIGVYPFALIAQAAVVNPEYDQVLQRYYAYTVPLIDVDTLATNFDDYLLLDTRSYQEYSVSRLPGANFVGSRNPDLSILDGVPYNRPIVVYCTVGYRSEKIGEKLRQMGYTHVYNLYGSIFEWANRGHRLVDSRGEATDTVHTYSARWSKWLENPAYSKVWQP